MHFVRGLRWLGILASFGLIAACTSFSTDASAPEPPAEAGTNATPAEDGAPPSPQVGCNAPVLTDFSAPLELPFTHQGSAFRFESRTDGKDSFGRFTLALPEGQSSGGTDDGGAGDGGAADAGGAPDPRYFLAIDAASTFVCLSARTRVVAPPPATVSVILLATLTPSLIGSGAGISGLRVTGNAESAFAGWKTSVQEPTGSTSFLTSTKSSEWHVTRLELRRSGDHGWRATVVVDGQTVIDDAAAFPPATPPKGGVVSIGPLLDSANVPRPAPPPVVVDYADLRFVQRP